MYTAVGLRAKQTIMRITILLAPGKYELNKQIGSTIFGLLPSKLDSDHVIEPFKGILTDNAKFDFLPPQVSSQFIIELN